MFSLLWRVYLPSAAWTVGTVTGNGATWLKDTDTLGIVKLMPLGNLSGNPVSFSYQLIASSGEIGTKQVRGQVDYQFRSMINPATIWATLDPLNLSNLDQKYTLQVVSAYAAATPPVGTYTNCSGAILTNSVTSPAMQSAMQFVCNGWTMTGNEPVAGSGTNCVLTLTNNAVLTWNWAAVTNARKRGTIFTF